MVHRTPVRHYKTIDSTNLEARRLHDAGERGPLWLVSDEQTGGRGRLGRNWISPRGNLYSTLLLPVAAQQAIVPQLGFVVALAVRNALSTFVPTAVIQLKWPNDCLAGGAKISGILSEVLAPGVLAIGCGINVEHAPEGLRYPATSLRKLGSSASVNEVFAAYRAAFSSVLALWRDGAGFGAVREQWQSHAIGVGERVAVSTEEIMVEGIYTGIADDGALLLTRSDGRQQTFHAGELCIPSLKAARETTA